jgi:hypothetical protein
LSSVFPTSLWWSAKTGKDSLLCSPSPYNSRNFDSLASSIARSSLSYPPPWTRPTNGQGISKEKRQHANRPFRCLVVAIRPLRVEELAEIFQSSPTRMPRLDLWWAGDPKIQKKPYSRLVPFTVVSVIDDTGSHVIQFSHFR